MSTNTKYGGRYGVCHVAANDKADAFAYGICPCLGPGHADHSDADSGQEARLKFLTAAMKPFPALTHFRRMNWSRSHGCRDVKTHAEAKLILGSDRMA
ncbi:MAG: hypothetical protein R2861_14275 [Desulfobacterales bacterium]